MVDPVAAVNVEGINFGNWRTARDSWQISSPVERDGKKFVAARKTTLAGHLVFSYRLMTNGCSVDPDRQTIADFDEFVTQNAAEAIAGLIQSGTLR